MKRNPTAAVSVVALTLAVAWPAGALAQSTMKGVSPDWGARASSEVTEVEGPVVDVDVVSIAGEVTDIDRAERRVAVRGTDGRVATLFVGPGVRNFDNLALGDEVTMNYTEAVSVAIARSGPDGAGATDPQAAEIRAKVEADTAGQAAAGGKPGMAAVEETTLVANVFRIDRQRGVLTLRGTDDVPLDVKVPDKAALDDIDVNDQVVIGYREAAVVSIQPGGDGGGSGSSAAPTGR